MRNTKEFEMSQIVIGVVVVLVAIEVVDWIKIAMRGGKSDR